MSCTAPLSSTCTTGQRVMAMKVDAKGGPAGTPVEVVGGWAASPGWDAAWESALASHPDEPEYDPGADEAAITDAMILSQVQSMPH